MRQLVVYATIGKYKKLLFPAKVRINFLIGEICCLGQIEINQLLSVFTL